jgi:hypothetical protein
MNWIGAFVWLSLGALVGGLIAYFRIIAIIERGEPIVIRRNVYVSQKYVIRGNGKRSYPE